MAEKKGKRQKPKLSAEHERMNIEDIWGKDRFVEKVRFEGGTVYGGEEERFVFDDCLFKDVSFSSAEMKGAEFVDVVFERCDFSNAVFEDAVFRRCEIIHSKLTGADFSSGKLAHVLFTECEGRYMNFNFSELNEVDYTDCNLTDADFYECNFAQVRFEGCKLENSNFSETDLEGVDLSGNTYDRIEVSLPKIAGCIVSKEQAIGFAQVLGLMVKED